MSTILDKLKSFAVVHKVNIPGYDGDVYLKGWTVQDSLDYFKYVENHPDEESILSVIVALSLCDEHGTCIAGIERLAEVKQMNAEVMTYLHDQVAKTKLFPKVQDDENPSQPDRS